MKAQTFIDPKVKTLLNELFYPITINPETPGTAAFTGEELGYRDLVGRLGVTGYPASFFFDPQGNLLGGQPGFVDAATFAEIAEYVGDGHYAKYSFAEFKELPADQKR
jgi:thioredoxin-related protein